MKIALASDVHLEFGPMTVENSEKADVLVLAGDILVAAHLYQFAKYRDMLDGTAHLRKTYEGYA
jgi:predicted phosphodiesterase